MPCDSSYMEPLKEELNLEAVLQHLAYIAYCRGKMINVLREEWYSTGNTKTILDTKTKELCSILKSMTKAEREKIIYNPRDKRSRGLADWWEEHQKADQERAEEESIRKARDKARKSGLKKLTKEEREAIEGG